MASLETILKVRTESSWDGFGPTVVRIRRLPKNGIQVEGRKTISYNERDLGEMGTVIQTRSMIPMETLASILDRLAEFQIPAAPEFPIGCDGAFTELEVGGYAGKAHYRWWSEPPTGWQSLDEIAQEILRLSGINERLEEFRKTNNTPESVL